MTAVLSQQPGLRLTVEEPEPRRGFEGVIRTRADALMVAELARILMPRERVRPSEWAAANVKLNREQTARDGPYDPNLKPFVPDMLDVMFDHPEKAGFIWVKCGQIGASLAAIVREACDIVNDPGPTLLITTDDEKAADFMDERLKPILRGNRQVSRLMMEAGRDRRQLMASIAYPGGRTTMAGAGTESNLVGTGYRKVIIDEFDLVTRNYRGDVWMAALARVETYKQTGEVSALGHPKRKGEGIDRLFAEQSDMQAWTLACPSCGHRFMPSFSLVRFARGLEDGVGGRVDPLSAALYCPGPACGKVITDGQRARALWKPEHERWGKPGGTGRFECIHPKGPAAVAGRRWAGRWTPRLADPGVTVRQLAERFASCTTEQALDEFWEKHAGEPRDPKPDGVISVDTVKKCIERMPAIVLPGGQRGCKFATVGADVQAPRDNPHIYAAAVAFGAHGYDFVWALAKLQGFAAYQAWLGSIGVELDDGTGAGGGGGRRLAPAVAGIDDRYESGQVKDACRATVYSGVSSGVVQQVPVGFAASSVLNGDQPWRLRDERKRVHPTRPELGPIEMFDLHRHSWVDRVIRRMQSGHLKVVCEAPADLEAHLSSQVPTPKKQLHNWTTVEMEWDLAKDRRDDWLMAIVYAYAVAAICKGLDRIHLMGGMPTAPGRPRVIAPAYPDQL